MKITFYGHSCFLLDDGSKKILTDPFLTGNPLAAISADDVSADYIFVSHGHGDHIGDAVAIARRTGAVVVSVIELCEQLIAPEGLQFAAGNIGGKIPTDFGSARIVRAVHGSGVPGALACGFLFEAGGKKIYFAGDTALTADMQLLRDDDIDVALLPIGGAFTMEPEDAVRAVRMIQPKLTVPMHYNTFPFITRDPEAFASAVRSEGFACKVMNPGDETVI